MAVYTRLSRNDITQFLAQYTLGELREFHPIQEGIENTNYLIITSEGKFILTLFENRVNEKDIPFFIELKKYLASCGIACPKPMIDQDGRLFSVLANKPAVIVSFLHGRGVEHIEGFHLPALGEQLANMHNAVEGFHQTRQNDLSIKGWQQLFDKMATKLNLVDPALESMINKELDFLNVSWDFDIPRGVIHADLFPDNVFFEDETLTGVIDFYFACTDYFAYDLAICINAWCFDPAWNFKPNFAASLVKAYHRQRPLSETEISALSVLLRGAAIRFLLTRSYDFINQVPGALVKVKNPHEYSTKLAFHQQHPVSDWLPVMV
ncbi:MAG: homoserine kinase [Alphaproteobacteria bacterium]|nr:homoserine kinase [Alphaproteobacteria bacterium]